MKSTFEIFKTIEKHSTKWDNYFDIYDEHLNKYIGKNPNVLEIGVAGGGSLEMWSKFFENGQIFGIDIEQECLTYQYQEKNIHISIGDQSSPEFWDFYLKDKGLFDVIVDDGSHVNEHQVITLLKVFPHLNDGGTIIFEDTHTSYWEKWHGAFRKPDSFIEFTKNLIDLQHRQHIDLVPPDELIKVFQNLKSITFYNSVVVFKKDFVRDIKPLINKERR